MCGSTIDVKLKGSSVEFIESTYFLYRVGVLIFGLLC